MKFQQYPEEPVIEFVSFTKYANSQGVDETGDLTFSFTDGDGDLGLGPKDTLPPFNFDGDYYYNTIISYFEKQNGQFVEIELDPSNNGRFPDLTPEGKNKGIKGEITVDLFINNPLSQYDTIKYSLYIVDRATNKSNVIETPEIVINK